MKANDYIDETRHRRPAHKTQPHSDPRTGALARPHPPKPGRRAGVYSKLDTLERKYSGLAAKYSELAEQARGASYDDAMLGSERSEPMPSETVYRLMSDMARMIVRDLKEKA